MQIRSRFPACWMASAFAAVVSLAVFALGADDKPAPHVPAGVVADWTHRHALSPETRNPTVMARVRRDPRWLQNGYLRRPEGWWPGHRPRHGEYGERSHRDWSVPLSTATPAFGFEPLFDLVFNVGQDIGSASLNVTDTGNGNFLATGGTLTITSSLDGTYLGTYALYPGGPGTTTSPAGAFYYDNVIYPTTDPVLDDDGLLFTGNGIEVNIWGNSPGNYSFYESNGGYINVEDGITAGTPVAAHEDPGGGQSAPAKFVFDVTAAPSCTNDYIVTGIPANPAAGGQANIVGFNNLYSASNGSGFCPGTGPNVMFAYASGSGQVPAPVVLSLDGTQIAYVENLSAGSSYFHVLTIGTTGTNGTGATAAVAPGAAGGNNAVDQRVLLSPDGGVTNQSSTNSVFVNYATGAAYATTYSTAGGGSGYLYKIANVFNGGAPSVVWSLPVDAVPSTPVYEFVSNRIFFTDGAGRIDYVADTGTPSVVYGTVLASSSTSLSPVTVDSTHQMVYATFHSDGANALVVQVPTSMINPVSVPVGPPSASYAGPYDVEFNNAWYTGSGTPSLFVVGVNAGGLPTLYSVGFQISGIINSAPDATTAALTTGAADSSPLTEFYNATLGRDFIFVGVTNNCIATLGGGSGGCVMALDITGGFPTVNAGSTSLAASGGTSDIVVDNNSGLSQASDIYYLTKTGATLVKATQSGLN